MHVPPCKAASKELIAFLHHNSLALIVAQIDLCDRRGFGRSSGARTSPRDRGLRGTHSQAHADGCKKKLMGSVYNFVQ